MGKYQIFISYRRDGGDALAGRLSDRFALLGYKVFYDVESMRSGTFNTQILEAIAQCDDVLLVLPQNALDRCNNEDDWVRQELSFALKHNKNIIPVLMRGFEFPKNLPSDIDKVRNMEGVVASSEYFDAVIQKIEKLLHSSKTQSSNTPDLIGDYTAFISSVTISDYLDTELFIKNNPSYQIAGGIFYICQKVLQMGSLDDSSLKEFEQIYFISKLLYKLAEDKGYTDLCSLMRTISRDKYIDGSSDIKQYLFKENENLQGEFIDLIWKSLSVNQSNFKIKDYWEMLLKEVFIWHKLCKTESNQCKLDIRNRFICFISSVTVSDYLNAESFIKNNPSYQLTGGIFYICQKVFNMDFLDDSSSKEFEQIYFISKLLYKLAEDKGYTDLCSLMRTISRDKYIDGSSDIKQYLFKENENLQGEFIDLIWKSLSVNQSNLNIKDYWERLLKEVFIWFKICSK